MLVGQVVCMMPGCWLTLDFTENVKVKISYLTGQEHYVAHPFLLVILGDPAYPLKSWFLKPFSDATVLHMFLKTVSCVVACFNLLRFKVNSFSFSAVLVCKHFFRLSFFSVLDLSDPLDFCPFYSYQTFVPCTC